MLPGQNRATQSKRQPGSSIKPIADLAPALEKGIITAGTVYDDVYTLFGKYDPKNYNGYKGTLTVRYAIESSQNIPMVKIMEELGPGNSIDFLRKMGVTSLYKSGEDPDPKKNDEGLPLAIGGTSIGISPLEMAGAYAAIANGGEYITPIFFTKVTDRDGKTVIEKQQEKRRVLSSQNAYVLQNILTQPVKSGTATACAISGFDVAAKTGTTNGDKDRWLCGFTPYYSATVWYGFDNPEQVIFGGISPASRIWAAVMKDVHKGLQGKKFVEPSGIVRATICKASGKLATDSCVDKYTEIFVKGTAPSESCDGHVKVTICKASRQACK